MPNEALPDDILSFWQNQPVENPPMPLEELHRKARQFKKGIRRRNLREYLASAFVVVCFTVYIFIFPAPLVRAGSMLIIAGTLFVAWQLYTRATPASLPEEMAYTASLAFHRRELVRQRDLLRSVWRWYIGPLVPGLVVFAVGIHPKRTAGPVINVLFILVVFAGVVWLNHRAAARLNCQIDELNDLENHS